MTMLPRLEKVTKGLTGKERAILFLKARNAGEAWPAVTRSAFLDESQQGLYNQYMGVIYMANAELGSLVDVIMRQAEWMAEDPLVFEMLHAAAEEVAKEEGQPIDWRRVCKLSKKKTVLASVYLAHLSEQVRDVVGNGVTTRWKELRAVELVWEAMAADFDGQDPIVQELREMAASARSALVGLAERCGIKKLPEPEQDLIDGVWKLVDRAYDTLRIVKPEL